MKKWILVCLVLGLMWVGVANAETEIVVKVNDQIVYRQTLPDGTANNIKVEKVVHSETIASEVTIDAPTFETTPNP